MRMKVSTKMLVTDSTCRLATSAGIQYSSGWVQVVGVEAHARPLQHQARDSYYSKDIRKIERMGEVECAWYARLEGG